MKRKSREVETMREGVDLILVPTDLSSLSCEAFVWAALFATKFNAKLLILHVISEEVAKEMVSVGGNPWEEVLEREDREIIHQFSACLDSEFAKITRMETLVAVGVASTKIIEVAKSRNAGMIVMATHGRTGLSHALIGSTAEKVVRLSPCPVFSVKPSG
jgi:nucleotide-binding universal stress UspA family protein